MNSQTVLAQSADEILPLDFTSETDLDSIYRQTTFYEDCGPTDDETDEIQNSGPVYMVGDSITVTAKQQLENAFDNADIEITGINADSGRAISKDTDGDSPSGIEAVREDAKKIKDANTVIIALGTNSSGGVENLNVEIPKIIKEVRKANENAKIYWVNIFSQGGVNRTSLNTIIKERAVKDNYTVINTVGAGIEVMPDRIHPTLGGSRTFAKTIVENLESGIKPGTGAPKGLSFPKLDPDAMGRAIDKYIEQTSPGSKMKGLGPTIVASAKNSNISPFFIVAIAQKESGIGDPNYGDGFNVRNANNSFGRAALPSQPHVQGSRLWYKWTSIKASVDHTAPENKNAAGGGDAAAYLKNQYGNFVKDDDLVGLMHVYAPEFENDTALYIQNIRTWIAKMVELTKKEGGSSGTTTATSGSDSEPGTANPGQSNVTYKALKDIPLEGITTLATTYGGHFSGGRWVPSNGIQGGGTDDTGYASFGDIPLPGKTAVAELKNDQALGHLPYGKDGPNVKNTKLEISYKGKAIIAEKWDWGTGGSHGANIDLWWETARLLGVKGENPRIKIRAVDENTPVTPINGTATTIKDTSKSQSSGEECVCRDNGKTASLPKSAGEAEKAIFDFYIDAGYSPEQAAGFVGNYYQESGYDPTLVNGIGATGIAQWLGGRLTGLQDFAREKDQKHTDFQTQLDFSLFELERHDGPGGERGTEDAAFRAIKAVTGTGPSAVEQVTVVIRVMYERPGESEANDARRIGKALEIYKKFGDGAGGTVVTNDTPAEGGCGGGSSGTGTSTGNFIWPLDKQHPVSSCFGNRSLPGQAPRLHGGIDISAPAGTPIEAVDGGIVEIAGDGGGFGNTVVIKHANGKWTLYGHMKDGSIKVQVGDKVDQGQEIGAVNNTGASFGDHLHFNVQTAGGASYANAVDPLKFLPKDPGRGISGSNCPSSLG